MTVPNFPQSPSDGDPFVSNGITYVWNANGSNEGYWQAQEEDGINAYWSKTGNTLFPTDAADDVEIGGGDIKLKADGSAEFVGRISGGGECFIGDNNPDPRGYLKIINNSTNGADDAIRVTDTDDNNVVEIRVDGSAKFKGAFNSESTITTNGRGVDAAHFVQFWTGDGGSGNRCQFRAFDGGSVKATINSLGDANFNNMRSVGLVFELETDNEANYTVTTDVDEDGNETENRVYNGPTLDVKETLTTLLSRIAQLEATVASLKGGAN